MEFKAGDFIHHNHYGVGRILDTADLLHSISTGSIKEYTIRFQDGEVKTLTQELLDRGAHHISSEGFKAYWYLDEAGAKDLLTTDPVEVISMVLHDFPGQQAKNEDFKAVNKEICSRKESIHISGRYALRKSVDS